MSNERNYNATRGWMSTDPSSTSLKSEKGENPKWLNGTNWASLISRSGITPHASKISGHTGKSIENMRGKVGKIAKLVDRLFSITTP
ncbi:1899_t:CDS:2 [Funneliformis mosseae]|uniref:1899_t:CDS:1 n=1 Tax=Funneliformis mosseae TaxID=27381 RepID=A0A9N9EH64_FUNMO|nr:1899_t:CDS:2 [Funneliformis mosseae]